MRKRPGLKVQCITTVPPIVLLVGISIALQNPVMLFFVLMTMVVVFATVKIPNHPKKKAVGPPKVVKIPGVGSIEWVTDPSQLDHKRLLDGRGIKNLEAEVLCSPSEWIEMGEKVVIAEEEAANAPEVVSSPVKTPHNIFCTCQKCHSADKKTHGHVNFYEPTCNDCLMRLQEQLNNWKIGYPSQDTECEEITAADQVEPIAYVRGGVIKSGGRLRLADNMINGWQ